MKLKVILAFSVLLYSTEVLSQSEIRLDTILRDHVSATEDICNQIRRLRKEIEQGNDEKKKSDSLINLSIDNVVSSLEGLSLVKEDDGNQLETDSQEKERNDSGIKISDVLGALIGAGAALLVFYLGLRSERRKQRRKDEKEKREKIHYFASLIKSTIERSNDQIDGIEKFCGEIDQSPISLPLIPIVPIQDIKRLSNTISKEEYYHAYLDELGGDTLDNVESFRKIASSVDFIERQLDQVFDMQWKKLELDASRRKDYARVSDEIISIIIDLSQSYEQSNPQFSGFLTNVYDDYINNLTDRTNLEYMQEKLIEPLWNGISSTYRNLTESNYLILKMRYLTKIYQDIPLQNQAHSNDYKEIVKVMKKAKNQLAEESKNIIETLGKRETV